RCAVRHWTNAHAVRVAGKLPTTPLTLISNQGASPFDDLDFEWSRQRGLPLYVSVLVVADTANLIADLRVEGGLLQWLVGARTRPPVCNFPYLSVGGLLHHFFTHRIALLAFDVVQLFAL